MTYKFELTVEKINLILKGLGNLPAIESMNLILELQQEARKQEEKEEKPK